MMAERPGLHPQAFSVSAFGDDILRMAISHHTFLAYGDGTWASHLARTGGQHTILKPNGVLVTVNSIGFAEC